MSNVCTESGEMESYDYLRECISNLENKNSDVGLAANLTSAADISLQGDDLDDVNLSNIDFNFMKIESLLLQSTEEFTNCTKSKEEKTKQDRSTDIGISHSIRHFNTMSLNFPNFSNSSNKESDDVTITVHNNESYIFDKDQYLERKKIGNYNSVKSYTENNTNTDSNINKDNSCTNQSVTSELKHEIKINNLELLDGDEQIQKCEQCDIWIVTWRVIRKITVLTVMKNLLDENI